MPNRALRQIIKVDDLRAHFKPDDLRYLRYCEVDMALYDAEGNIVCVEEVQRGDHHNDPEWIRKDALKRRALALACIPFIESF